MKARLQLVKRHAWPAHSDIMRYASSQCEHSGRLAATRRSCSPCEPDLRAYVRLRVGPSDTCRWTTLDVKTFLEGIRGENFLQAAETCFENCVDGKTLASLTQEQLESLLHLDAREALALSRELKVPTHVCAT